MGSSGKLRHHLLGEEARPCLPDRNVQNRSMNNEPFSGVFCYPLLQFVPPPRACLLSSFFPVSIPYLSVFIYSSQLILNSCFYVFALPLCTVAHLQIYH